MDTNERCTLTMWFFFFYILTDLEVWIGGVGGMFAFEVFTWSDGRVSSLVRRHWVSSKDIFLEPLFIGSQKLMSAQTLLFSA